MEPRHDDKLQPRPERRPPPTAPFDAGLTTSPIVTKRSNPTRARMSGGRATAAAAVAAALLLSAGSTGCSWVTKPATASLHAVSSALSDDGAGEPIDPVDLQEDLLRFADNLTSSAVNAAEALRRDGKPLDRTELLRLRVFLGWDILTSATGANAFGNLVDLLVLTTAGRMRVEDYWMPKVYGASASAMLEAFRSRETMIWRIARAVIRPEQQTELLDALNLWRRKRAGEVASMPMFASIALIDEVTKAVGKKPRALATSVFALLDLDPLAGLDPATRELAQTRLFAERALFIGQRMPQLLQWQAELLSLETAQLPEVQQVVTNSTQLAASADRLSHTLEQTPALISSEREHILDALRSQQQGLTALSKEFGVTLAEGGKMAAAANEALKTFRSVADQFKPDPSEPKDTSEPFRIRDYAETAAEITKMSKQLKELLNALQPNLNPQTFSALSAQADAVAERTEARGMALVNHAYRMAVQWVAVSALILLAAALTYRYAATQMTRNDRQDA